MDIDVVAAIVNVPEIYVSQIKLGMPATVRIDGFDKTFDAKVAVVNHRVDHQTRSIEVRIAIPNKDHKILPGLFCNVELKPAPRKVLVADRKYILGGEDARYAYVLQHGRAKKIVLSARDLDAERLEILSNVPDGTQLIGGPSIARLADGVAVTTQMPPAPPSRTAAN
jgi:multidrug efflux pump subunit AcrA (membrane-fusion protein)